MAKKSHKISARWTSKTRDVFRDFLEETDFLFPDRIGERGPAITHPEWLIIFLDILSVKLKIKTYVQIHKMAGKYSDVIAEGLNISPISERTKALYLKSCVHWIKRPARANQMLMAWSTAMAALA